MEGPDDGVLVPLQDVEELSSVESREGGFLVFLVDWEDLCDIVDCFVAAFREE